MTDFERLTHRIGLVELRDDEQPQCLVHKRMLAEYRERRDLADYYREKYTSTREALQTVKRVMTAGCADCKIKPNPGENFPEQCGECRWFYADLRVPHD